MMQQNVGLGIDLGGTKISGALFDADGMISESKVRLIGSKQGQEVCDEIKSLIGEFLEWGAEQKRIIERVGIAVPGIYYSDSGKVWCPNIPGWDDYPLYQELSDYLSPYGIEVSGDSDRACYILGEVWKGAARGCSNAIFLAVGTGIGAGILIDGNVLRGANDIAGAIGWLAVTHPFKEAYQSYGCFEYHASGNGIARMAQQLLQDQQAKFKRFADVPVHEITAKHVFEAYTQGDSVARTVIHRSIEFWGKASANLVSLFNPEKIIFGGGVFGPAIELINDIYDEAEKWSQPISIKLVDFEASQLGSEAGLYGAGFLSLNL